MKDKGNEVEKILFNYKTSQFCSHRYSVGVGQCSKCNFPMTSAEETVETQLTTHYDKIAYDKAVGCLNCLCFDGVEQLRKNLAKAFSQTEVTNET